VIILDMNVLSEADASARFVGGCVWLDARPTDELPTSAVKVAEVFHGVRRLPDGRGKDALEAAAT
jgi:hypothetical protein